MKKYLSGLLAVILAVGFSAFTEADENLQIFQFVGDVTDLNEVANTDAGHWELREPETFNCGEPANQAACVIVFDSEEVLSEGSSPAVLKSTITLNPLEYLSTGVYYVDPADPVEDVSDIVADVLNRESPE